MDDRLRVGGRAIEVREWRGSDPPLVLLHEGLGSISMWGTFPTALAERTERRVFAYSRLGHGKSDPPPEPHTPGFMHEEAHVWLPAVLDAVGIGDAVLVGHSDGASIALIFAATAPARVHALVLEAPHVLVEPVSIASINRMKTRYETTNLRERLARHHTNVDVAFRGWNDVWLDPLFVEWSIVEYLPRIVCPVLLVQGEQDEYGTLRQLDTIAGTVRGRVETLVLAECGHAPHRDQPRTVLTAITRFLTAATGSNVSPTSSPKAQKHR